MADELSLSSLRPAQARKDRKRVGRGQGSGKGRYSGRGLKGQKSRSGSAKMRPGFEGGQMPLHMRVGKQRGATSKDAMPIGPFRTYSQPVNVSALNGFDDGADVTPELLAAAGLVSSTRKDVKILGNGELSKKLSVTAHRFSATAREKIEAAGGTVTALREPGPKKRITRKRREAREAAAARTAAAAEGRTGAPDPAVDAEPTES
jgi:large subunit ribosomal protein L15